jgi:CNT family concentrative nucleoside transporter
MRLQSLIGIFAMVAIAWAFSENRRAVSVKRIGIGLAVTVALALLLLKVKPVRDGFAALNGVVDAIAAATRAGTSFVFGYLGGGALPFDPKFPGGEFIFAFQALPVVLIMSVLTTLLF